MNQLRMNQLRKRAVKESIPVMTGYIVLGMAFGLLLQKNGYNFLWALLISLVVYAGSMQFVLIGLLSGGASLLSAAITTLSVNSRHIFYGLSFIEKFKTMGRKRFYMIFSLTDETYSLLCSVSEEDKKQENQLYFMIALLNQCYWILGSVAGSLIGDNLKFNTNGIEFSMTALFVVIFVEQWLSVKNHFPAMIGLVCGVAALVIFGSGNFILPALITATTCLMALKSNINRNGECTAEKM